MADGQALEHGFRLQFPGTQLWFNVTPEVWGQVRHALEGVGCAIVDDPLAGEEVCQGNGLVVSYSGEAGRMRAEVDASAEADLVRHLEALHGVVPAPDAEASAVWIWGSAPFVVAGRSAQAAQRVMRAARWTTSTAQATEVLMAAAEAAGALGDTVTMHATVAAICTLDLASPQEVRGRGDLERRASTFGALIARLGVPARAEYATVGAGGAEG